MLVQDYVCQIHPINDFLGKYNNSTGMSDCTEAENRVRAPEEKNCLFDKSVLGACAKKPYGYVVQYPDTNVVEPCFFLKFNKGHIDSVQCAYCLDRGGYKI